MTALTKSVVTDDHHLPRLAALCGQVERIISGKAAADLDIPSLPNGAAIAVLPSWVWIEPKIDVGRKGRTRSGEILPMPSRIVWSTGPVIVIGAGETVAVDYQILGLGHDEHFVAQVGRLGDFGVQINPEPSGILPPVLSTFSTKRQAERILRGLVKAGEEARWELLTGLESFTMSRLNRANTIVTAELAEYANHSLPSVLDEIAIEDLLAKMLYGENGSSVISNMVDRAIDPKTFRKVDPMHYFAVGVRARAEEAVRQRIGDPKIGPKVRRVASKYGFDSMQDLIEKYRELYPRDSLAMKRAIAALTAGPEVTAYQKMFHDHVQSAPDGEF